MSTLPDLPSSRLTLLAAPDRAGEVVAAMQRHRTEFRADAAGHGRARGRYRVKTGTAIIPVTGPLFEAGDVDFSRYGFTSYSWLAATVTAAADDAEVTRIVLTTNSPGGTVTGLQDASAAVVAARARKQVIAHVTGVAASAAFWVIAGASEIVAEELALIGSIGAVIVHVDYSRALEQGGVTPTIIAAGAHKADGNALQPLPEEVRADLQAQVENIRLAFAQSIASARPARLTVAAALATEARIYASHDFKTGSSPAQKAGLIDRVGTLADVLGSPSKPPVTGAPYALSSSPKGPSIMSAINVPPEFQSAELAYRAGVLAGREEAAARIKAIITHPNAKGRDDSARTVAFTTDMSPESAGVLLASIPANSDVPSLDERMKDNPANAVGFAGGGTATGASPSTGNHGWAAVAAEINKRR